MARGTGRPITWAHRAAAALVALLAFDLALDRAPLWLAGVYVGMGALAGLLYLRDKSAARRNMWRISESTLHMVDLFGGIIGGLLTQEIIRHKTAKAEFRATSLMIAGLHGVILTGLLLGLAGPVMQVLRVR